MTERVCKHSIWERERWRELRYMRELADQDCFICLNCGTLFTQECCTSTSGYHSYYARKKPYYRYNNNSGIIDGLTMPLHDNCPICGLYWDPGGFDWVRTRSRYEYYTDRLDLILFTNVMEPESESDEGPDDYL